METTECEICPREMAADAPPDGWVHRTSLWSVLVMPGLAVPGWLVLELRRHAEGLWELTDDEASELGTLLKRVSEELRSATQAEKIYAMTFGDRVAHVHVLVAARSEDVPVDKRGPAIIGYASSLRDPDAAAKVADVVRSALAQP